MDCTDFSNLFIDYDDFEEEEEEQRFFENNGPSSAKYITVFRKSNSKKFICKIFDPKVLQSNLYYENKYDQSWYRQLILLREAIFLKNNHHPAIVDFRGFNLYNYKFTFDDDDNDNMKSPTIFLEYLKNKSLKSNIYEHKINLDPIKRQICIIGITSAIRFLHSRKILHRSLNPSTIWLDNNLYPKVFDFSTTRAFSYSNDTPKTILKCALINYQAPEIIESNFDKYDDSIDIFSLGRLIYLMVTGYEPYSYPDDQYKTYHEYGLQEPILSNIHPFFPDNMSNEFKKLLERCWSFNPNDRPTAAEIYNLLVNEDGYIISEIESEKDRQEMNNYIEKIDQFEREMPIKPGFKLFVAKSFEYELPLIDEDAFSDDIAEQVQTLLNFTSSNFASSNEDDVLKLLIKMADNQSIYQNDYLPKVINFVNNSSQNGNILANEFLLKVFGKYCVSNEIVEIESGSFLKSDEAINIPPNVRKICKRAFADNTQLVRINIPNSVTVIEDDAFSGCINLKFVNIPKSIEGQNLGKRAFKGCSKLKYIQIPSTITMINKETFKDNESLSKLIFNNGLETIGESAFNGCKSLKYIEIPKTVNLIQKEAFYNCKNLSTIYFHAMKKPKTEKKGLPSKYKALP